MAGSPEDPQENSAERAPMSEAEIFVALEETSSREFAEEELGRLVESMERQPELVYEYFQYLIYSGAINEPNTNEAKLIERLKPTLIEIEGESGEQLSDQVPEL